MVVRRSMAAIGTVLALAVAVPACADDSSVVTPGNGSSSTTTSAPSPSTSPTGEDLPGNCDEAEHADDPECQGGGDGGGNSGPGGGSGSGGSGSG